MHHLIGFAIPEMLESVQCRPHPCFADRLIGGLFPVEETAECYEDCPQRDAPTVVSALDIADMVRSLSAQHNPLRGSFEQSNLPSEVSLVCILLILLYDSC